MVVVLFRSRLTAEAGEDYSEMAQEMSQRAKTMPGYIDFKSFLADDGEHLSVIRWESLETLKAWSADSKHLIAQRLGRQKWYEYFKLEIAELQRSYEFTKPAE